MMVVVVVVAVSAEGDQSEDMGNIPRGSVTDRAAAIDWVGHDSAKGAIVPRGSGTKHSRQGKG